MRISLLHPSRGRPEKAVETSLYWHSRIGDDFFQTEHQLEYILSLDADDSFLSLYELLWKRNNPYPPAHKIIVNNNKSVVNATNKAAELATGDVLIYLSDDFKCPDNWVYLIANQFENVTEPLLIKVDDCLQKFEIPVLTIPIMNQTLYEKLGYFWHPDYKSMFVDEDLFWTSRKLGALKYCPHLKFPHEHPANGKAENDETYTRSAANWEQGKAVFAKRKLMGFPV